MDFSAFAKVLHKKKMRTNESRRKAPPTTALPAEVYTEIHNFAQYNFRM